MHIRDGPLEQLWGGGKGKLKKKQQTNKLMQGKIERKENSYTASSPEKSSGIGKIFLQGKC